MTWWLWTIVGVWTAGTAVLGLYLKVLAEAFGGKAPWQLWVAAVLWPLFVLRAAVGWLFGFKQ